jgi:hypothetical protein
MKRNEKGLIALAGAALLGGLAYWKYRNLSAEEKAKLKSKVKNTGKRIKDSAVEVENSLSEKLSRLKGSAKKEVNDLSA